MGALDFVTNLSGAAPGGIGFEHNWTAGCGLLSQRKTSAEVWVSAGESWISPLMESPEGCGLEVSGKPSEPVRVSIKSHKNSNALYASNLHLRN